MALAVTALAALAFATSAGAAPATGDAVLTLKKGAKSSLLRDGVKVSPRSGKGTTQKVTLKVDDADAASKLVKTGTTLTFRANGKSVKVSGIELKAGAKSTAISGLQGGKRKVFFRLQGDSLAVGNALSAHGPLALTGTGAKALGTALAIDGIKSGKVGSANFSAVITTTPVPEPPKKEEEKETPKGPYPYEAQCPVAAAEGNPGFGEAPGNIESTLPLPLFDPALSREVTGGDSEWGFKDSFRSYVLLAPPAGSLQALDGAAANPAVPTMAVPGSFWSFPTSEGDYEPGTEPDHSDDKLVVEGEGTILFCKSGHGFNVVLSNPTVVIDGANSRIVADVGANFNGTWYPLQRADIADLDLSGVEPELTDGDTLAIWEDIPVELTADGEKALGGIYEAGAALDPITVEASLGPEPPEPYPFATECPVPTVEGGMGDEPGVVEGIEPAPVFNAGTSQTVTGTVANWGFKSSFRGYVLGAPPAGTLQTLGGATASAEGMGMAAPTAYFGFPAGSGSYEPGTEPDHSDDKLVSESTGTVLFCKPGHGFNVVLKNPTVTIDGENSRITADVGVNLSGEWFPFQRVDIAALDLDGVEPEITEGGNKVTWKEVPATLTDDGETAIGGLYSAGEALDKITVETAITRPLLTQCTIASGTATPPAVEFPALSVPSLTSPVTGSGGTINWGFRRSLRSSVAATGSFQLLGGATEGYPGSMGGGASPAPTGGEGKFFRFPVSEYQYEAGTADPGDDRLVATSDATVGFCNPAAGNYGLVLSKPTLIIDGAESRLVANAYSYSGGFPTPTPKGWIGGRVTLVKLDTSAVDATSGAGTISWGEVTADNTPLLSGIPVSGGLQTEALSLANLTKASTASGGFDQLAAQITLPPAP